MLKSVMQSLIGMTVIFAGTLSLVPSIAGTNPGIAPIQSKPHGHSYSEWAATWWQWALGQAASVNPVLDTSGQFCTAGQYEFRRVELRIREGGEDEDKASDDKAWVAVWFLAGTFGDPSPISRTCTIPADQALFFPVVNAIYGAFLNDPPEQRTEKFIRSQVDCTVQSAQVEIDRVLVNNPQQYFLGPQKSILFDIQLPTDNVLGVTSGEASGQARELLLSPSADSGIYLFLHPLPPGKHALHWKASQTCPFGGFTQDVTYELTVQPPVRKAGKAAPIGHGRHIP